MRLRITTAWLLTTTLCACGQQETRGMDRDRPAQGASPPPDSFIVITPEQYEASLGLKPVRDSADAVARAFRSIGEWGKGSAQRLRAMTRDSSGYRLTIEFEDRSGRRDTTTVLVKRNGAVYPHAVDIQ